MTYMEDHPEHFPFPKPKLKMREGKGRKHLRHIVWYYPQFKKWLCELCIKEFKVIE